VSIAIVASPLANKPMNGGFAWVPLSYALGLGRLGFDVYLFEQIASDQATNRGYFERIARQFGFERRSALLHEGSALFGLEPSLMHEVARDAELLVNVSGHATLDWAVSGPRLSAYIDTDPGFTQVWNRDGLLHESLYAHTHHFSVGCNLGGGASRVPDDGIPWRPLPPPVVLEHWPVVEQTPADMRFTTVATWRCPSGLVSLDGERYLPSKLHEFRRMLPLPHLVTGARFEIALDIQPADEADRLNLLSAGWSLVDPHSVAADPCSFRAYVAGSSAEFSTVQGVYSVGNTGWISDRSARYLACGRPVLIQDTGVPKDIARDEGMLVFTTLEQATRQAERIAADYAVHSAAARQIAEEFFDSDRVLGDMVEQMGARP
jgi:hypothetical protein